MHKQVYKSKAARWFSQWSRKAYAIFLSISKVVHIGRLSVDTSQQSLLKSCGASILPLAAIAGEISTTDLAESPDIDDADSWLSAFAIGLSDLFIVQNQKSLVACAGLIVSLFRKHINYYKVSILSLSER